MRNVPPRLRILLHHFQGMLPQLERLTQAGFARILPWGVVFPGCRFLSWGFPWVVNFLLAYSAFPAVDVCSQQKCISKSGNFNLGCFLILTHKLTSTKKATFGNLGLVFCWIEFSLLRSLILDKSHLWRQASNLFCFKSKVIFWENETKRWGQKMGHEISKTGGNSCNLLIVQSICHLEP